MIAIYYVESAGPYKMYVLDINGEANKKDFLAAISNEEYPMPDSDIVFINNGINVLQEWLADLD